VSIFGKEISCGTIGIVFSGNFIVGFA